jgi:hypothetical protein
MSGDKTDITERDNQDLNVGRDHHKSRPTINEEDAKYLERIGLLKRTNDDWCKVSFDIMHAPIYNAGRNETFKLFFPSWGELPNEIKLIVMQHNPDMELISLGTFDQCHLDFSQQSLLIPYSSDIKGYTIIGRFHSWEEAKELRMHTSPSNKSTGA